MRYAFMASHEAEYRVQRMSRAFGVARSGYYAWKGGGVKPRAQANEELLEQIQSEYEDSRRSYGAPRIRAALQRKGVRCSRKRVAQLMRLNGISVRPRRRWAPHTTQADPKACPAPNHLAQDFSATGPNLKWVSDFTYIATGEGWLYLAAVVDLFSRKVIGWAMSEQMDMALVRSALQMAIANRTPNPGWLHHSDRGRQYTSQAYQDLLQAHQVQVSMSRKGNCYDNATMESFFGTLKRECVTKSFATHQQARTAIFEYIEAWYNRQRLHSSLDYRSPEEFELAP
jgi:putative transposase